MLQWYIRVLADSICNHIDYTTRVAILVQLLGMGVTLLFLVIMLRKVNTHFWRRYRKLTPPGGDVKNCQQAFLALLPGMACEQSYCADINLGFVLKIYPLLFQANVTLYLLLFLI